ncbi:uncharacterized protein [Triticum aestivum]|uniref:uncharacterized protein n=1 Tax=Triticum aestivum TaxID=4565 RepID=UPI001D032507|nr:uncharacterized protein LOC123064647 [Triticum aestivum]
MVDQSVIRLGWVGIDPPIPPYQSSIKQRYGSIFSNAADASSASTSTSKRRPSLASSSPPSMPHPAAASFLVKMEFCEQCFYFLREQSFCFVVTNNVATGKQHIGYGLVRDFLVEYKAVREAERLAR